MTSFKTIIWALAGISFAQISLAAPSVNQTYLSSKAIGNAIMQLNAASLGSANSIRQYNDIWSRMRPGFDMMEVNPELVRQHERYFSSKATYVNRTIDRGSPYLYYILSEVEKRGMPSEIALLPFIESAYVTKAKSPVGASGLWQFMPATGKQYGLEQSNTYDGRHDITASTDAALTYLQYLYSLFGDWSLALGAYNWGEGNMARAIRNAESQGRIPVYENLKMPNETRNYVPKLLAIRNLVANPDGYNMHISKVENKPYFEFVDIDSPMDIKAAAHLAGISDAEFLRLNPGFNLPVFLPKSNRKMILPKDNVKTFYSNYKEADNKTLLSWDIYTPISKENINNIATNFGMTAGELRSLNLLKSSTLNAGQSVLVAKNTNLPQLMLNEHLSQFNLADNSSTLSQNTPSMLASNTASNIKTSTDIQIIQSQASEMPLKQSEVIQMAAIEKTQAVQLAQTTPIVNAAPATSFIATTVTPDATRTTHITDNTAIRSLPIDAFANTSTPVAIVENTSSDPLLALLEQNQANSVDMQSLNQDSNNRLLANEAKRNEHIQNSMRQSLAMAKAQEAREERLARSQVSKSVQSNLTAKHTVQSGDTLTNIAKRYDMSVNDLTLANQISGDHIQLGQTLKVALVPSSKSSPKNNKADNIKSTNYVVKKGDTLSTIAKNYNVQVNDIQKWNKSFDPRHLRPGQKITLYGL